MHRCWAEIDLDALRENLAWIRHAIGPGVRIITVVKADAYGHGLKPIARQLMQSGTDVFGVANLTEAEAIRSVGRGWPILMLGACLPDELEVVARENIMATVSSLEEAQCFSAPGQKLGKIINIHIKIDTGMGRLGVAPQDAAKVVRELQKLAGIRLSGVYTHYAAVEDNASFTKVQRQRFEEIVRHLPMKVSALDYLHANNSGGILWEAASTYSAVRPGLLVYGVLPAGRRPLDAPWVKHLRPALTWKTRVALVKAAPKGASLSYGGAFKTKKKMTIAIVAAGYGDGYPRAASNRSRVLIAGELCPVLGRITMDQMLVDVTHLPAVKAGDEVVLLGSQNRQRIDANQLAQWAGTIPWEVLTGITYRVPRIYRGESAA